MITLYLKLGDKKIPIERSNKGASIGAIREYVEDISPISVTLDKDNPIPLNGKSYYLVNLGALSCFYNLACPPLVEANGKQTFEIGLSNLITVDDFRSSFDFNRDLFKRIIGI